MFSSFCDGSGIPFLHSRHGYYTLGRYSLLRRWDGKLLETHINSGRHIFASKNSNLLFSFIRLVCVWGLVSTWPCTHQTHCWSHYSPWSKEWHLWALWVEPIFNYSMKCETAPTRIQAERYSVFTTVVRIYLQPYLSAIRNHPPPYIIQFSLSGWVFFLPVLTRDESHLVRDHWSSSPFASMAIFSLPSLHPLFIIPT